MKHLIMGTAGHVDHGKTALVKALTGIDCDTHPEEKRRGITINLGFAHLDLPNGDVVSIIDVPGHKDFVHTMVSGASGIDFVLLVIAADSGVMPQTREHLAITQMLGVRTGIIVLSRVDLIDEIALMAVTDEVKAFAKGTFLENCPILPVSSVTGIGIPELKKAIADIQVSIHERASGQVFRMFIDRIFSVPGFGTVVTGSVISGRIKKDDRAYILPGEKEVRVRRLEHHGREVSDTVAGDRASMNLAGLSKDEFKRGMVVSDRVLHCTTLVDIQLKLFPDSPVLDLWSQVIFLQGTFEAQAKMHLVDRNSARAGETVIAQVHLPEALVTQPGDRFVVRSSSSETTLGGGEIIDASPLHHRRRPRELVDNLVKIAEGKTGELVASEVRKRIGAVSAATIANALNTSVESIIDITAHELPEDVVAYENGQRHYLLTKTNLVRVSEAILRNLHAFRRENPLASEGRSIQELLGLVGLSTHEDEQFLELLLNEMVGQNTIVKVKHTYAIASDSTAESARMSKEVVFVEKYLKDCALKAPIMTDLLSVASRQGIDEKKVRQVLKYFVDSHKAYRAEDTYVHASIVDECRIKLLTALDKTPAGMTVAQFRDLINGNRKICLLLLGIFDAEKVIERTDDVRKITDKGRALLPAA